MSVVRLSKPATRHVSRSKSISKHHKATSKSLSIWDAFVRVAFCLALVVFLRALAGIGYSEDLYINPSAEPRSISITPAHIDPEGDLHTALVSHHVDTAAISKHRTYSSQTPWPSVFFPDGPNSDDLALDDMGRPFALRIHLPQKTFSEDDVGLDSADSDVDDSMPLTHKRARRPKMGSWGRSI